MCLRCRDELQERFRHDAERPLRAREELRHIVAGDILDILAARVQHVAVRENDFEPLHVVFRDAVLESAEPAGVLRDRPAEACRLDRAGIGRIDEAVLRDVIVDVLYDHARLDLRDEVLEINVEDLVEAQHQEDNAALERRRPRREIRSRTARIDRHVVRVRQLHDAGNFLRRTGTHDDVRQIRMARRCVIGVRIEILRGRLHVFAPNDFFQLFDQFFFAHLFTLLFQNHGFHQGFLANPLHIPRHHFILSRCRFILLSLFFLLLSIFYFTIRCLYELRRLALRFGENARSCRTQKTAAGIFLRQSAPRWGKW